MYQGNAQRQHLFHWWLLSNTTRAADVSRIASSTMISHLFLSHGSSFTFLLSCNICYSQPRWQMRMQDMFFSDLGLFVLCLSQQYQWWYYSLWKLGISVLIHNINTQYSTFEMNSPTAVKVRLLCRLEPELFISGLIKISRYEPFTDILVYVRRYENHWKMQKRFIYYIYVKKLPFFS